KIWIPDLKLVPDVLIGELDMTDEKIPGNFNIHFLFLSPNYVTFTAMTILGIPCRKLQGIFKLNLQVNEITNRHQQAWNRTCSGGL
ncbi:hypothetical protein MYX76_17080, partial [Desulfobacterota bacterium AH_259_B03_O07]|nr:hypothetical protein [Desulfobacterota bacterium AH_259_B03_O07]